MVEAREMKGEVAERIEAGDVAIKTPSLTLIMLPVCKQQREALAKSVCTTATSRIVFSCVSNSGRTLCET